MLLAELVDAFKVDYKFECLKRDTKEIYLTDKYLALMLSKTVSDLQKRLGIIEVSSTLTSTNGTQAYSISSSFMNPKAVLYDSYPLEKKSTQWIKEQYAQTGTPTCYAIQYEDRTAKLFLYPTPNSSETILLTGNYNYQLYSPSGGSTQDFGVFDGTSFSSNTVLPTQYDAAMLLGMMKQIFKDVGQDYDREISLLRVRQYNGEKFTYELGQEKYDKIPLTYSAGVTVLNEDFATKEIRITAAYGGAITTDYTKGWNVAPTFVDDGSKIIITSSGEFSISKTQVDKNDDDADAYQVVGDETNTIHVNYYGADYGYMTIRIRVW